MNKSDTFKIAPVPKHCLHLYLEEERGLGGLSEDIFIAANSTYYSHLVDPVVLVKVRISNKNCDLSKSVLAGLSNSPNKFISNVMCQRMVSMSFLKKLSKTLKAIGQQEEEKNPN